MTDTLRITPRYIRNTDAFGWQGADKPDGPWRSITPPQTGTPLQTAAPVDELCQASAEAFGIAELSPAAQAVLDAAFGKWMEIDDIDDDLPGKVAAAALRAAADQVVPLHICGTNATRAQTRLGIRHKLLAIAAELEVQP